MDYKNAAKKLIVYSRSLAKGSLNTVQGLALGETPVLHYLSTKDKDATTSPSELASQLGYTRARMTRILDSLEVKGYIMRRQDDSDRRRIIVQATEAGRTFSGEKDSEVVSAVEALINDLGEHDTQELIRILQKGYKITYGDHSPDDLDLP
jgi:DNA-binding MarR family transcriptional regulator